MRLAVLLSLASLAAAGAVRADDGEAVATRSDAAAAPLAAQGAPAALDAPAPTGEPLSTDEQIRRWLAAGGDGPLPGEVAEAVDAGVYDRRPHGEVTAAIGTGGMRAFGGSVTMPIGENGWLGLSYHEGHKLPWGYGYGGYGAYGRGYSNFGANFSYGGGSLHRPGYWR